MWKAFFLFEFLGLKCCYFLTFITTLLKKSFLYRPGGGYTIHWLIELTEYMISRLHKTWFPYKNATGLPKHILKVNLYNPDFSALLIHLKLVFSIPSLLCFYIFGCKKSHVNLNHWNRTCRGLPSIFLGWPFNTINMFCQMPEFHWQII